MLTLARHRLRTSHVRSSPDRSDRSRRAAHRLRSTLTENCGNLRLLLRLRPGQAVVEVLGGALPIAAAQPCGAPAEHRGEVTPEHYPGTPVPGGAGSK